MAAAVSCARSISLYPSRSNPTVNVSRSGRCSAASAQIAAESMPPDRNAPSGAWLRRWTATESRIAARIARGVDSLGWRAGRRSARQKR